MNDAAFGRLIWKEYRVQRGFWLAMAGLAVACQALVLVVPNQQMPHATWLFGLALVYPAFYALGCAATLFAAEREEGTLEQLRLLAAPALKVWWSKLGFALASTVALLVVLLGLAFNLGRRQLPDAESHAYLWALWGVGAVEFLAWGLFFSLLLKRPLTAAVLGAVTAVFAAYITAGLWLTWEVNHGLSRARVGVFDEYLLQTSLARLGAAGLILALDGWIAIRWVLNRPMRRRGAGLVGAEPTELAQLQRRALKAGAAALVGAIVFPLLVMLPGSLLNPVGILWRQGTIWKLTATAAVEAVAWGILFALVCRRDRWAVVLAAAAGFLNCQLVTFLNAAVTIHARTVMMDLDPWLLASPLRLGVAASVLAVDVWLALRWQAGLKHATIIDSRADAEPGSSLSRLIWQEWRQAWRTLFVLIAVMVFVLTANGAAGEAQFGMREPIAIGLVAILASLMGSCVFLAEQEGQQFRFFADRGVGLRVVWLSKLAVWLPVAVIATHAIGFMALFGAVGPIEVHRIARAYDLNSLAPIPWIAFACGQLASMLIARGLVAGFVGLVLSGVVIAWHWLMLRLGVPLWWSVAPIPAALLAETWFRAPDWLLERCGRRPWLRLAAALFVPFVALSGSVAAYRVLEIPGGGPGFSPAEFVRPVTAEERETAELYGMAVAAIRPLPTDEIPFDANDDSQFARDGWDHATPLDRAWVERNHHAIERLLEISWRPACAFGDGGGSDELPAISRSHGLSNYGLKLLLLDARRLESEGDLDAALERYLSVVRISHHVATRGHLMGYGQMMEHFVNRRMPLWAAHPDQTTDRLRRAIRELESLARAAPTPSDAIKAEYLARRHDLDEGPGPSLNPPGFREDEAIRFMLRRLLPFEQARAHRLLDCQTQQAIEKLDTVTAAMARDDWVVRWFGDGANNATRVNFHEWAGIGAWQRTTATDVTMGDSGSWASLAALDETQRRALRLILAIKAWQIEHGELPKSLDQLVPAYFDRVPLDPWTGEPFGYEPAGFPIAFEFEQPARFTARLGQPILWSAGASGLRLIYTDERGQPRYEIKRPRVNVNLGTAAAFPIP